MKLYFSNGHIALTLKSVSVALGFNVFTDCKFGFLYYPTSRTKKPVFLKLFKK